MPAHVSAVWEKEQAAAWVQGQSASRVVALHSGQAARLHGLSDRDAPPPPKPTFAIGAAPSLLSSPPCAPGLVVLNISQLCYRTVELLRTTGPGAPAHTSSARPGAPQLNALLRPGPRGPAALRAAGAGEPVPFMPHGRPARRRNAPAALAGPVFPGPRVARRVGPRPRELLRVPARGWP